MAHSQTDFLMQAAHNFELAKHLRKDKTDFLDWAVTCLFYSAVFYVHAYLAKTNQPIPQRHRNVAPSQTLGRHEAIQRDPHLNMVYSSYRHLDDESRDARYQMHKISQTDYDTVLLPKYESLRKCIVAKVMT